MLALPLTTSLAVPFAAPASADAVSALVFDGGPTSSEDPTPVPIDADLYLPAQVPAPAVVLAHGFGGSKASVMEQAQALAQRGFVVLAYTARGFGASGGSISMNAPDFEIADARKAIDTLAALPEVTLDGPGDPRVGFAGGSYGGALSLLTAGYDTRVDAVAADITWNSLERSLFPQFAVGEPGGVYQQWWAGSFFSIGLDQPPAPNAAPVLPTLCGRFADNWCRAYVDAASRGLVTPESRVLMQASSPASIADRITVPTLIGAGQADSLFPLAQANATAEAIMRANPEVPVKVVWHGGGHDGGVDESDRLDALVGAWMDEHLRGIGSVGTAFEVTLVDGAVGGNSRTEPVVLTLPEYPGLRGNVDGARISLSGPPQPVRAPAGGVPAAISTLPGVGGSLGTLASAFGGGLPGQVATFASEPLDEELLIAGSSLVTFALTSAEPVEGATFFASLRIVSGTGTSRAPQGLVAAFTVERLGPTPTIVEVELPGIVAKAAPGDRIAVTVSTTDAGYRLPAEPAVIAIALADDSLAVAELTGATAATEVADPRLLLAVPIIVLILLAAWLVRPRHRGSERPDLAEVPVSISGLSKTYKGGLRAVDDVTFQVPRGIVLGLLGPNGAGKTTTMRMLMGLISPTEGEMHVFGEPVRPGAPVLARVGALVEGAGFLPHLTGRQNLDLYWRAAGRAGEDPHLDTVMEIAGLGSAVDRKVKSYSQGMRQRLGIAQAMLGYPDLLMLDEPTNGLDPPQIREMRDVLRDYAATGRTVIVSSHLLAEVEMTCTHVVVMHRGRLVAQGEVDELLAGRTGQRLEDVFLEIVGEDRTVGGG